MTRPAPEVNAGAVAMLCRSILLARALVALAGMVAAGAAGLPPVAVALGGLLLLGPAAVRLLSWRDPTRLAASPAFVVLDGLLCALVLFASNGGLLYSACLTAPLLAGLLRPRWGGWLVGGLAAVVNAVAEGFEPSLAATAATYTVAENIYLLVAGGAGVVVRASLRHAEDVSLQAQAEVAAAERRRLARELHDSVVKTLHGVRLLAASAPRGGGQALDIAGLERTLGVALDEARALVGDLRFAAPEEPLPDAVRRCASAWSRRTGVRVRVDAEDIGERGPEVAYEVGCILREALENVERHADASEVVVRLTAESGQARLEVADDGAGFAFDGHERLAEKGRFGVVGMVERAQRVGGTLEVRTAPGRGTSVTLRIAAERASRPPQPRRPTAA